MLVALVKAQRNHLNFCSSFSELTLNAASIVNIQFTHNQRSDASWITDDESAFALMNALHSCSNNAYL